MEDSVSGFVQNASDQSVPGDSWCFQNYGNHDLNPSTLFHSQSDCCNNYDSDSIYTENYEGLKENDISSTSIDALPVVDNGNGHDPFSLGCRIPVPGMIPMSRYHLWLETSFMCKRNERERQRVRNVNDGFSRLRNHLPRSTSVRRRQSKVETLHYAIKYIKHLQSLLDEKSETSGSGE